jgi:hypothetical protein
MDMLHFHTFLVLLKYCSISTVVLEYQYQGFSIVLQYKTARRVVHRATLVSHPPISISQCVCNVTKKIYIKLNYSCILSNFLLRCFLFSMFKALYTHIKLNFQQGHFKMKPKRSNYNVKQ